MSKTLFKPEDIGNNYEPRLIEFREAGEKAGIKPAADDKTRTLLLPIDMNGDFVWSNGALSVPGAVDDERRLVDLIYRETDKFTEIWASLDQHVKMSIFHSSWWKNIETGLHPDPFTPITFEDIKNGVWQALKDPIWSVKYVELLEVNAKKNLMIWPDHCIRGTDGQKLVPALREAIEYHAGARSIDPTFIVKGTIPQVEHYGIFASEVFYPKNPKASGLNTDALDIIANFDRIYVAGEAKSHCVLETMKQMLNHFSTQPDVISKIHFLMDCTSSVQHPAIDFETLAMAELKEMEAKGVVMAESTDPIK